MISAHTTYALVLGVALLLPAGVLSGQGLSVPAALAEFKAAYPKAQVDINQKTGLPEAISGLETAKEKPPKVHSATEAVTSLLAQPHFTSIFSGAIDPSRNATVETIGSHVDVVDPSRTIVTVRQTVGGIPVFGSESKFVVTEGRGGPAVAGGHFSLQRLNLDVPTKASVTSEAAADSALKNYKALLSADSRMQASETSLYPDPRPTIRGLSMFDPALLGNTNSKGLRPTWIIAIGSFVFFVDATSGLVVHDYRNIHSLTSFRVLDFTNGEHWHRRCSQKDKVRLPERPKRRALP